LAFFSKSIIRSRQELLKNWHCYTGQKSGPLNQAIPADADEKSYQPTHKKPKPATSDALSIIKNLKPSAVSRKVAILAADGFDNASLMEVVNALKAAGAHPKIVSPKAGTISSGKHELTVDYRLKTVGSVLLTLCSFLAALLALKR